MNQETITLYRKTLRWAFDHSWGLCKKHRESQLALRTLFERNRREENIDKIILLQNACRSILWTWEHPEPYKCIYC